MGNCQTIDAAALVIQHPSGKIERLYCPVSVSEVMRMNPGHYVSLIIPLPVSGDQENQEHVKTVQFTRVKLLRPSNTLALGHAYRLVTTQVFINTDHSNDAVIIQVSKHERHRHRTPSINSASLRSKSWRPSLQSISEAGS
ncbi:hypothetical protein D5086_019749 [Populus alba]|uniref:Uncharacterized protein n=1 Tax=Populus alba TaxID=43335 RepID=A0ACC4BIQ1_POPAL